MYIIGVCASEECWQDYIEIIMKLFFDRKEDQYKIIKYYKGEDLRKSQSELDLLIIDVCLADISGIELVEEIGYKQKKMEVIFLTSHIENDVDISCIKTYRLIKKDMSFLPIIVDINQMLERKRKLNTVKIKVNGQKISIKLKDIIMIEAVRNGTNIYYKNEYVFSNKTLIYWEKEINNPLFCRSHRSYLVNLTHIKTVSEKIYLKNGYLAEISRRRKTLFLETFFKYIEKNNR